MATSMRKDYCCVPLCRSDARRDFDVSFHHIPKDETARRQWLTNIRREPGKSFRITSNTVVCSKHFVKEDFKWTPNRRTLKQGAAPSFFVWTEDSGATEEKSSYRKPSCYSNDERESIAQSDESPARKPPQSPSQTHNITVEDTRNGLHIRYRGTFQIDIL